MVWRPRLGLLGRNRAFAAHWGARTVSSFGNWVTLTALLLYLESTGASGLQVGIALAARELPHLLGPVTGALADRLDPRRVMIGCDLANSLFIGAIVLFLPAYPVLIALIAASSVTTALFMPSGKSAVPKIVPQAELTTANTLLGSSTNLSFALGPVAGAFIFSAMGFQAALLLDVATFLVSSGLLLLLPSLGNRRTIPEAEDGIPRFITEIGSGIRFVAGHAVARAVAIGMFFGVLFAGVDNVALVFLVRDSLGGPEIAVGIALGAYAVAMIIAPLLMLRLASFQASPALFLIGGMMLMSVGLLLTGVSPVVAVVVAAYAVAGAGNGLENIGIDTLIGRSVPADHLGRAFGVAYGPIFIAGGASALIGGQLVDLLTPSATFLIGGAGVGLVTVLVWRILPRNV